MRVESGLQVQVCTYLPAPHYSRSDGAGIKDSLVSVVNGPPVPVSASGLDGFARLESPAPLSSNRRPCQYIGNSLIRRKKFDVDAIARSGRDDAARHKAERNVTELVARSNERDEEYGRLCKCSTRDNTKRMDKILEVNSSRLRQAQELVSQLGNTMSKEINLDTLIELYKSFSVGKSRTVQAPGQATSLARSIR